MSDVGLKAAPHVGASPPDSHQAAAKRPRGLRKGPPARFTHRITFSVASDQVDTLAQATRIYRASEAFVLRLAWDNFCRANNLTAGAPNGR